jgi:hypothetical protein
MKRTTIERRRSKIGSYSFKIQELKNGTLRKTSPYIKSEEGLDRYLLATGKI